MLPEPFVLIAHHKGKHASAANFFCPLIKSPAETLSQDTQHDESAPTNKLTNKLTQHDFTYNVRLASSTLYSGSGSLWPLSCPRRKGLEKQPTIQRNYKEAAGGSTCEGLAV